MENNETEKLVTVTTDNLLKFESHMKTSSHETLLIIATWFP